MNLAGIGTWLAISAGIYTFFSRFDDVASEQTKADMAGAIRRNPVRSIAIEWPAMFNRLFDKVYGPRYLSLRFLLASLTTTLVTVPTLFLLIALRYPNMLAHPDPDAMSPVLMLIFGGIFFSILPDALGLLKSRFIIGRMKVRSAGWLILADAASSLLLSAGCYLILFPGYFGWRADLDTYLETLTLADGYNAPYAAVFYSTLTTSLWALMFLVTTRLLRSSVGMLDFVSRFLDIDKKPFSALGLVSVAVTTALFAVGGLVSLL